jgi:hypothetical protein
MIASTITSSCTGNISTIISGFVSNVELALFGYLSSLLLYNHLPPQAWCTGVTNNEDGLDDS